MMLLSSRLVRWSSSLLSTNTQRLRLARSAFSTTASSTGIPTDRDDGDDDSSKKVEHPKLKEIPSLPFFGSTMITAYSGLAPLDMNDMGNWYRNQHKEHGPFYSFGFPGLGSGWHGTTYVVRDPHEMLKVIKQEGAYPSGLVEKQWPTRAWMKKTNNRAAGIMANGEEWKRLRSFMQKDLLSPASAREYLPGMIMGARKASKKAQKFAKDGQMQKFLNFAAMDMFAHVLFGGDDHFSKEEYARFCNAAVESTSQTIDLVLDPLEVVAHNVLGFETPKLKKIIDRFIELDEIAQGRLGAFLERAERDELTEHEKNSYFYKMMQRQPGSGITQEEVMALGVIVMIASVDTTAGKTAWSVLQLALHQDIQQELYEQLHRAAQREGGQLTAAVLDGSEVPLLPAFIRETYRCTSPLFNDIVKIAKCPVEVHGTTLPEGSTILFDSITHMWDPDLVEDPMDFKPERWFKDAVEARKGTPSAIIDNPMYSGPFSQGARRCPGSRVANLEEQTIIAQLLLDWRIEGPSNLHWKDAPGRFQTLFVPDFPKEVQFVPRS